MMMIPPQDEPFYLRYFFFPFFPIHTTWYHLYSCQIFFSYSASDFRREKEGSSSHFEEAFEEEERILRNHLEFVCNNSGTRFILASIKSTAVSMFHKTNFVWDPWLTSCPQRRFCYSPWIEKSYELRTDIDMVEVRKKKKTWQWLCIWRHVFQSYDNHDVRVYIIWIVVVRSLSLPWILANSRYK